MARSNNSLSTIDLAGKVEVLHARYHGRAFAPHWHEEYAVGLIVDGVESFAYRGATHHAISQQIILLDAGEIHTGEAHDERGFGFHMLYIPHSTFREVAPTAEASRSTLHFPEAVNNDRDLAQSLRRLHSAIASSNGKLEAESLLLEAMSTLLDRSGSWKSLQEERTPPAALSSARELLHAKLFEDISLEELARQAGVSKFHLLRSFRRHFGLPPHAYQLQQRVFQVKRLLGNGRPVADIAVECGFTDQSHLNRVFRSLVGTTPGQYAAQFRTRRSDS